MVEALQTLRWHASNDHPVHWWSIIREPRESAILRHWGLVEQKARGLWTITDKGRDFLDGRLKVPKYVLIRGNRVVGYDGEMVSVEDCRKQRFELKVA